jgi:hypothetical protein
MIAKLGDPSQHGYYEKDDSFHWNSLLLSSLLPGSVPGNLSLIPLGLRSFVAAGSHPLGFSGGCLLAPQLG